jgi:DNA-binding CsgD family transcriptional regulator
MRVRHLAKRAQSSPNALFGRPERHGIGSYESELIKIRLRESLAREHALHRQIDALVQHQWVLDKLFGSREEAAKRVARLTPRERQVMEMILAGEFNKNIAADIGISQRTVENHRASVMRKTGSKSLPALARLALAAGWNGPGAEIDRIDGEHGPAEPAPGRDARSMRISCEASIGESKS